MSIIRALLRIHQPSDPPIVQNFDALPPLHHQHNEAAQARSHKQLQKAIRTR
jgi:hypothetical protein